jgi:RNA polymerase sigma factor (sigma-70 family)
MSATALTALIARCRVLCRPPSHGSDAELLQRFTQARDPSAFEELLERHAALVWSVCRRLLPSEADCEDAFQATFLALVRRADAIKVGSSLGAWLHTVAVRAARKALVRSRRQQPQAAVQEKATSGDIAEDAAQRELFRLVDEEIQRLPAVLREPLILCCLQGQTRDEAAEKLGRSIAAIKSRLGRGRNLLRRRLERRGVQLPAAFLILGLTGERIRAALWAKTTQAVYGSAPPAIAALVPAGGISLTSKLAVTTISLALVGVLSFGAYRAIPADPAQEEPAPSANRANPLPPPAASEKTQQRVDQLGDPLPPGAVLRLGSNRLRPGGSVRLLAFSPDSSKIACLSNGLSVWDAKTGRLLRRASFPIGVQALTWRPDGRRIVILEGLRLREWDYTDEKDDFKSTAQNGAMFRDVAMPAGGPAPDNEHDSCFALSPDGKTIAVGRAGTRDDKNRPLRLVPLLDGIPAVKSASAKELGRQPGNCGMLLFTPDGKKLVALNKTKELPGNRQEDTQIVVVWDTANGKEIVRFTAPRPASNGQCTGISVSNRMLAIGLEDGATSVWDLSTGKERRLDTAHVSKQKGSGYGTFAVAFTPGGKTLVTGGRDGLVKVWDVAGGRNLHTLKRHHSWVESLAVSPDGRIIASSGQDGLIRLWDVASGQDACPQVGHRYAVWLAAFTPDGKTALTAGWDNTLRWWDMTNGKQIRVVEVPGALMGLAISPDGQSILGTAYEGRLHTWETATGRETTPAHLPREKVGALAFSADGKHFVSATGPHFSVWEWPTLKLLRTIELPKPAKSPGENDCQALAISPDGRWLLTVAHRSWYREEKGLRFGYGADGVVDLWDLTNGQRIRRLVDGQVVFKSATFTREGQLILVGGGGTIPAEGNRSAKSFEGEINLLDPLAARHVRSFASTAGPPKPGVSPRYTGGTLLAPDGRTLYVAYSTGEIIGYEVATGQPRRTLAGHREYVGTLACVPDGRRLISGGVDGTALVWGTTLAAAASPRKQPLDEADIDKLWKKAAGTDSHAAFAALADLAAAPERAVALLQKQIKPIPKGPSDADLDRLFEKLDSDDFVMRDKASHDLAAFGESAVPGVRKRLVKGVSLELRLRALAFLDQFEPKELSPERLRQLRAVELLEGIGTPAAKKLLSELAHGAPGVPLTLDATAALARLERTQANARN